jgi:hypothetical protein
VQPAEEIRFVASQSSGEVSALWLRPEDACAVYVFAHGAGAGMQHAFMEALSARLARRRVATLRYQFPYMERGSRRVDPRGVALATVRAAVETALQRAVDLPLFAGGKSYGGRMTSMAAAEAPLEGVRGIAFVGFPLHPAGKPGTERAAHLAQTDVPLLFLQGTRDKLAESDLVGPACADLGGRATLCEIAGADHSFHVLKRSGRNDDEVLDELADSLGDWMARHS